MIMRSIYRGIKSVYELQKSTIFLTDHSGKSNCPFREISFELITKFEIANVKMKLDHIDQEMTES